MKVAVIGSGSVGLIYLKNLKEDGLDVTGFDRSAKPGGIWVLNNDEKVTCALPSTRVNFSKHRVCTSDFPHLDSVPLHPSRQDMEDYHLRYAHHFDLLRHIKFNTEVVSVDLVDPDADEPRYVVTYRLDGHEERDEFDKIVVATGLNTRPNVPKIQGMEQWEGEVWNSQSFKSGATLRGKNVVVVGSRSSASDVLEELVRNGAGTVYMSHRRGVLNVPRGFAGKTLDFYFGRRAQYILDTLDSIGSYWARGPMNLLMGTFSKWSFNLKDEWNFKPFPDIYSGVLTISDVIVPLLEAGRITSVPSIASIDSPNSLTLANGNILHDIDAIVFATGYLGSLPTVLSPAVTARMAPPPFVDLKLDADSNGSDSDGFLHLYRGVIAASLPSVAIHVRGLAAEGVTASTDLMGMWLAGVWTGQIPLASEEDRWKGCLADKAWHLGLRKYFTSITPGHIRATVNFYWFAQQVGCEIDEHLSWTSWSAWKWWLSSSDNRRLSTLLLDGMASPATYRLWGKKRWDGAREMIERANASSGWTKPTPEEIQGLLAGEGGSIGLVYLKNFKAEGLDVTGFDRAAKPGGLWIPNTDEHLTCALPSTRTNFSKHRTCTADFPHLPTVALHATRQDMEDYHLRYAKHFDLLQHIEFRTEVISVDLVDPDADADEVQFIVTYKAVGEQEEKREVFDKVLLATGLNVRPNVLSGKIAGMEGFKGEVWNSQSFKGGAAFKGKNVVVVGCRSSASDVIEELARNGAGKIYMSHRRGVLAVPRGFAGKALDYWFSRRGQYILDTLDDIGSYWASTMMNFMLRTISKLSFTLRPEWNFTPYPDTYSSIWTISDVMVPLLEAGRVKGVLPASDVASMWLASVWNGTLPTPSEEERWKGCLADKAWHLGLYKHFTTVTPGHVRLTPNLYRYAQQLGCEIDTHLSWSSLSAWKWWFASTENRRLSTLLLDGMASPAVYRMWGPKRWEGAREMVERANAESGWTRATKEELRGVVYGPGDVAGKGGA